MTSHLLSLLAQIDPTKVSPEARLDTPATSMTAWLVGGVLSVLILLVAFKTSRRNATDRDD